MPAADIIMQRQLRSFGHVHQSDIREDHARALHACLNHAR